MDPHIGLNRRLQNTQFASWRLANDIVAAEDVASLPGPVAQGAASDTAFSRVAAHNTSYHNHISVQPSGAMYTFHSAAQRVELCKLQAGLEGQSVGFQELAVLGSPLENGSSAGPAGEGEPALQPTVAEVQGQLPASPAAADAGSQVPQQESLLLASQGLGDLVLVGTSGQVGPVVHPLGPLPPLQGVRPFQLLAAFWLPAAAGAEASSGEGLGAAQLVAVVWAVRQRVSSHQPACCEVFALRLAVSDWSTAQLEVRAVELLRCSALPPHGAAANPALVSVLVAVDPDGGNEPQQESVAQRAAGRAVVDDDSGDVSPRTLQAAVARLAQFTSDQPAGELPRHQMYADVFQESGPDGVGALGSEPGCTLFTYSWSRAAASSGGGSGKSSSSGAHEWLLVERLACAPHRLLACHWQAGSLLLGLTDDVDCAVVQVAPTTEGHGFTVLHLSSVPALAYVAVGKVQRKFLQLALPGGDIAAALVEAKQYAYLYRSTAAKQVHGEDQVVVVVQAGSGSVLGTALLGSTAGSCRLLVLAQDVMRVFHM